MKKLNGRVDHQSVIPEVETLQGTFTITVKDDNDVVVYSNDKEPYEYKQVPSLVTALELYGAKLSDDAKAFIEEALKGSEETGKAVKDIVDTINASEKTTAKNNRYQSVFNAHKPLTDENIANATASIVRNFLKTPTAAGVSDETAITTLQQYGIIPKEYTVAEFRSNKGKR